MACSFGTYYDKHQAKIDQRLKLEAEARELKRLEDERKRAEQEKHERDLKAARECPGKQSCFIERSSAEHDFIKLRC